LKILALIGSPRKRSNTDILVDEVLRGAETKGHTWEKVYLYDLEIKPCLDCRACKKGNYTCPMDDGMKGLYSKIEASDLIVFGTPIYWYGPTGKMKLLIDRLRPFIASGKLKGRRGLVVTPSEEGPGCCSPLVQIFRMSFEYLGMDFLGSLLAIAYERGEVAGKKEEMEKSYRLGASIL
jgi:multimeric flavodoxin WrbA